MFSKIYSFEVVLLDQNGNPVGFNKGFCQSWSKRKARLKIEKEYEGSLFKIRSLEKTSILITDSYP